MDIMWHKPDRYLCQVCIESFAQHQPLSSLNCLPCSSAEHASQMHLHLHRKPDQGWRRWSSTIRLPLVLADFPAWLGTLLICKLLQSTSHHATHLLVKCHDLHGSNYKVARSCCF